ncbi:MAG TPA: 2-amino-4-hydroxy-6-hydroxymethyldihydropteridine diphosphokinase [Victivallales bacterium]|nr:2-amino-4-hydroxy-6-hydroxymethyldihydropteridine diphosphokinase [Victivallales bacterium]
MPKEQRLILSLGANIGDINTNLSMAIREFERNGLCSVKLSKLYTSEALGCQPGTPDFINAALSGTWTKSLRETHELCKKLEVDSGRPSQHQRWSSRTLDIDIAFFGNLQFHDDTITIPHAEALNRLFVVLPVAEIEPDFEIPGIGERILQYMNRTFSPGQIQTIRKTAKRLEKI